MANVLVYFNLDCALSYMLKTGVLKSALESERIEKFIGREYPLTKTGKILVEKKPVKGLKTVKASVDLSGYSTMEYLLGIEKMRMPVELFKVELGNNKQRLVTSVTIPYQPNIHAHLEEDFEGAGKGTILDFDFSKGRLSRLKEMFSSIRYKN